MISRFALALSLVAFFVLGGCNAVLGIEEAHDRNATSAGSALVFPKDSCAAPSGACASCVIGSNAYTACLEDHDCRTALDDYRQCLGASCNQKGCLSAMAGGAGKQVAALVLAECSSCADTSPVATMCDLYCSCMKAVLPPTAGGSAAGKTCITFAQSELPAGWTVTGDAAADYASCKLSCKQLELGSVHCRWSHCELANNGELASHCRHAVSDSFCPNDVKPDATCTDRRLGGWGCERDDQCCSATCASNICDDN